MAAVGRFHRNPETLRWLRATQLSDREERRATGPGLTPAIYRPYGPDPVVFGAERRVPSLLVFDGAW